MAVDTLGVASWGLLRTAPAQLEHLAASWGLLSPAPSPTPSVARLWGIVGSFFRRLLG